jgi:hypothetical protein
MYREQGILTPRRREVMYRLAQEVPGFYGGGIGLYPDDGFIHVDVRGHEARWAKVRGQYVGIEEALV